MTAFQTYWLSTIILLAGAFIFGMIAGLKIARGYVIDIFGDDDATEDL